MKKLVTLLVVLVAVAGCNKEKIYKENLAGTWQVYKYILRNSDRTLQFQAQHPDYTISFTEAGAFTETEVNPDTAITMGTYAFADNDEKLVLTHQYFTYTTDTLWADTINYTIDTIEIPHNVEREFTIFNLTRDHVQLRNDSSERYMKKLEL